MKQNTVIYVADYSSFEIELTSKELTIDSISHTTIIKNENKALFVTLDDLSSYSSIEVLGTYDEVFTDITKNAKYLSVHDYETPIQNTNEDGTTDTMYKNKYIGKFAVPDEIVPSSISMRQCRLYLLFIELLDEVESIVSMNKASQIEWEYSTVVERDNLLIKTMQENLNLDDRSVDKMFIEASKL